MAEFQGFFAEFYDLLHQSCDDARFYPALLRRYGTKVLELGSGTGRIAIPLAQTGYQVTGIECEPEMIRLMERKRYPRENLRVVQADARSFVLDELFDVILLDCNFLNHFPDAADVLSILLCCKAHLAPHGVVIIDGSAPDAAMMAQTSGEKEVLEFVTEQGTVIRDFFEPEYDLLHQIETDVIRLEEWRGNELLRRAETREVLTWYYPREIRSLIREAGLTLLTEGESLQLDGTARPLGKNAAQMIFVCGK